MPKGTLHPDSRQSSALPAVFVREFAAQYEIADEDWHHNWINRWKRFLLVF